VCHAYNYELTDGNRVLIGIGFANGEISLHDPVRKTFSGHMNTKSGVEESRVTTLVWYPRAKGVLVSGHGNGAVYLWDMDRKVEAPLARAAGPADAVFAAAKQKGARANPMARWTLGETAVTAMAFSKTGMHLATTSRDGLVRVIAFEAEVLVVAFRSYFGAVLCVDWSPDDRFLIAGGEDDLLTLYSLDRRCAVARFVGHQSWVASAKFDYWTTGGPLLCFGSVGQDCRLLFWEFNLSDFRPLPSSSSSSSSLAPTSGPISPPPAAAASATGSRGKGGAAPSAIQAVAPSFYGPLEPCTPVIVPAPSRSRLPAVAPLASHTVDMDILSDLVFLEHAAVVAASCGSIKIWARPQQGPLWNLVDMESLIGPSGDHNNPDDPEHVQLAMTTPSKPQQDYNPSMFTPSPLRRILDEGKKARRRTPAEDEEYS
jgi:WD40 repeat protein